MLTSHIAIVRGARRAVRGGYYREEGGYWTRRAYGLAGETRADEQPHNPRIWAVERRLDEDGTPDIWSVEKGADEDRAPDNWLVERRAPVAAKSN